MKPKSKDSGKLRIGDDWNAIRIIALSQSNPLKAIAEFVENSIDAHAKTITITRGKEHNAHYLAIKDDGDGVPRDADGLPDFKYVATHICDSIKRRLKADGNGSGPAGRVRHRALKLLDCGRHFDHDLDGDRSEGLSDDDEQGGFALRGEPAPGALRGKRHGAQNQSLTRGHSHA